MSGGGTTNTNLGGNIVQQGTMTGGTATQNIGGGVDFTKLASQLSELQAKLEGAAIVDPALTPAAKEIAAAKEAAKGQNESGVRQALKSAGRTALDFAEKVGVDVAVAWMKQSMGLGA
jgi:hypothetical protein